MIEKNKKERKPIIRISLRMSDVRPSGGGGSFVSRKTEKIGMSLEDRGENRIIGKIDKEKNTKPHVFQEIKPLGFSRPTFDINRRKDCPVSNFPKSEPVLPGPKNVHKEVYLDDTDSENVKNIKLSFSSSQGNQESVPSLHKCVSVGVLPVETKSGERNHGIDSKKIGYGDKDRGSLKNLWEQGIKKEKIREVSDSSEKRNVYPWGEFSWREIFGFRKYIDSFFGLKFVASFSGMAVLIFFFIMGANLLYKGLMIRDRSLFNASEALASLSKAKDGMAGKDFSSAAVSFQDASEKFDQIEKDLNSLGGILVESTRYLPYLSKLSSGYHLAQSGEDFSQAGRLSGEVMAELNGLKNPLEGSDQPISYLDIFKKSDERIKKISALLLDAEEHLEKINISDIPEDKRSQFLTVKEKLPEINEFLLTYVNDSKVFSDLLGGYGPRKYLFLFQNNQEMRPTGGFIGTYAILEISNGQVRNFKVDGIFNPDGQLKEHIVPPEPIQKISANWSLHDSNWFPDFRKSAEKAAWFFEKTGGPTVDGVITMTPTVMEKLLAVTGPIEMPEYEVTIDKDNFLEAVQKEVEVDYDKELNQPKKILADLAPKILDRIFNSRGFSDIAKTMDVLGESLNEKQILIYSKNFEVEKILSVQGWSGEVLETQKDYLSVINANVNGFKTDGVIDESISHTAEIQKDGTIVDTVTIHRRHNGGDTPYDWWNRVNADYMRLYVPEGSQLISVTGHTREFNSPPLDYAALGYKVDPQLKMEDDSARIDEESGTRISTDSGKTVFANWVYVSPKEDVTVTYKYLLPFRIATDSKNKPVDTYSILFQKQSGSLGSQLESKIIYPNEYRTIWKYPAEKVSDVSGLPEGQRGFRMESTLNTDKFVGVALEK